MKSISQKSRSASTVCGTSWAILTGGYMSQHVAETMAPTEAKARANIMYRVALGEAVRIIEVKEVE